MKIRHNSRWFWLMLSVVVIAVPFIAPAVHADPVSGVVVDCKGNPISGALVVIYKVEGSTETPIGHDTSNATGVFGFNLISKGTYNVLAICPDGSRAVSINFQVPGTASHVLRLVCCPKSSSRHQSVGNATVKPADGLQRVSFSLPQGNLVVNLPDDMMAGDTITGTVIPEPKGSTEEERNRNRGVLNGYVVQIEGQNFPVNKGSVGPFSIRRMEMPVLPEILPGPNSFFDVFFAVTLNGSAAARARIPLLPSGAVITPDPKVTPTFVIPQLGQTGRPIVITGPFDGNSSNTTLELNGFRTLVQDAPIRDAGTIVQYSLAPFAESPRKAVFECPTNVTGPIKLTLNEGKTKTTGNLRILGLDLTAPKTTLLKDESTILAIHISGLQGITQPVPLHLTKGGVVTMQGGDVQTMSIEPAEVQSNGTFTTTRTVTGVHAGVWNATATVVVFDSCLQDDNNGNLLLFSSETGDYIFCQGQGTHAGANPMSVSTLNFLGTDFSGGVRVSASDINDSGGNATGPVSVGPGASITRSGAVIVADFNYRVGIIHVQIDGYSHSGSASGFLYPEITVPSNASPKKINFTITDRDTRNNTCACK